MNGDADPRVARRGPRATAAMTRDPGRRDPIAALLAGEWVDPDSGRTSGVEIAAIAIERSLRGQEADLVASLALGPRLAVVSDAVTHEVLGARIERVLAPLARVDPVVLPRDPHADLATVEAVRTRSAHADALIAVGSGTINDLAKYAAARDGKPYAVFATAPSMNGYTSANAAITVDGHKKTLPATLARGVFVDLAVLAASPPRMIRAGLGDSLCRPTAQVDWLLSHHLLGTGYRTAPFALLEDDEPALLDAPEALLDRDLDAMRALARTLVLSGLGMTLCGGSHPASQGEHLISHYLDMRAPAGGPANLHGEQVAVATMTMARIQETMLDAPAPVFRASTVDARALEDHFGREVGAACWRDFAPKRLDAAGAAALSERAASTWEAMRRGAEAVRLPADRLASVMRRAGGPVTPADLGVDAVTWAGAVRHARFLRDRYTFLDLADDAGMLSPRLLA
ncbi:glycerol-1-phosphate dehydrogenase [NAD(P)+] [Burkholderiales bacterium]|nr:glycerol-1-phosphate dehydrogenase [NAD(P)+] [Burkholderiales bacterium]